MKLVRYGEKNAERPGFVDNQGAVRDLSCALADITPEALAGGRFNELAALNVNQFPVVVQPGRFGVPISGIGKLVCIGLNYRDHAREARLPVPEEPVVFLKATSALTGPDDGVMLPRGARKVDWEVELGVVIGQPARYVGQANALEHVAGYVIVNDISERAWQLERGGQWTKGKSSDSFAPIGPWLVTSEEIPEPHDLGLWLELNGQRCQTGHTGDMIFSVREIVSYVSEFMTLMPGDIVCTGTPAGVGFGMTPPRFLRAGDTMRLGIDGLGEQRQHVISLDQEI
ncbi:2-keto-4-pentenoate hydratase/2-oxohepta-3-ene-1,7-dioic acid hydratase in catechol pathway [Paraburkholderia silvatlantica]|uniref:2-keto-4-pentenoate hydratase/2-oxohepta-3-ene-1,7-dioic acid hydratase in catechol pathway n=1 Tax=Paraburkholderia silvatlantica TaxID=321895 RepID=A0A2V4TM48_9BURK|nr:fumarylacetoacetate hydrolase family protein [Paraburkholderia silvatlantica]PYE15745.1 2-keto-4-pentenoate hydratase/2-oxohepta-3-ene-1,7-dioic acid hydratase in catechol pathway [Paraburkholderia silvatlantica]